MDTINLNITINRGDFAIFLPYFLTNVLALADKSFLPIA